MKAIAKQRPTEPGIDVVDITVPRYDAEDQVLVRVQVSSICGSQINI